MKNRLFAALALAAAIASTPAAKADSFNFYFTADGGVSGSGTLVGNDLGYNASYGSEEWLIESATGTFNDGTISGPITLIQNPNLDGSAQLSATGFTVYDNLLFPSALPYQVLDYNGLLFDFGGIELTLWEGGFPPIDGWAEDGGASGDGSFTLAPEPGSGLLLATGILALAGILMRRSLASSLGLNA
jgi:hypothetical protein